MLDAFKTNGSSPPQGTGHDARRHRMRRALRPDFFIGDHGSIFLLQPITPAADAWGEEYLPTDRLTWGAAVVVAHRYIANIVAGIRACGVRVE